MKVLHNLYDLFACIFCLIFIVCGSLISLHRYWQYEVSFIDFGQYDQIIWKVSRLQAPVIDHFVHGNIHVFADHLTPSIFLLSPLYWITDSSEVILLIQAVCVGLSGLFLYLIGNKVLKDKLMSLSILISYFLFVGLQNAVITEFHELTVMTLPFMAAIWAILNNKKYLYYIFFLITLGFKEITFSLGIAFGIALLLINKKWRRTGLITILISITWGVIAFAIIIPYFSKGQYLYASTLPDGFIGKIIAFYDHPLKRRTIFFSFFSFSFLTVFAPSFWLGILQDYASRFIPRLFITRWDLGMHYNAQSAVWLAVSSIFGLKNILRIKIIDKYKFILVLLIILNSIVLFRFILHGPFLLSINPDFYKQTEKMKFLDEMIKVVPKNAYIMAQNNIAARFTHQPASLLIENYESKKPEYILLDLREGQNPNNFCCNLNINKAKAIYENLSRDKQYVLIYKTAEQFVFRRLMN